MTIDVKIIKQLRDKTLAGVMDCKKALVESNGNIEDAVIWLRKKGLATASKKSGRVAAEGVIAIATKNGKGMLVELNSETDFVAKNDKFVNLATEVIDTALKNDLSSVEDISNMKLSNEMNVSDSITNLISIIGENIQLRRCSVVEGDIIVPYIHNTIEGHTHLGKIGVLVALKTSDDVEKAKECGKKVAMHIAAAKPDALNIEDLDPVLVEKERKLLIEQARESGKPEEVILKMIEGRMKKFYSEVVLLKQNFVMDNKLSVEDAVKNMAKESGISIEVTGYSYFILGDGIEQKNEDFASEVAKMKGE